MEKEENNKWLNWICQGILLTFLFSLTLFLLGDRNKNYLEFNEWTGMTFFALLVPTLTSWFVIRKSKCSTFYACIIFTLASAGLLYMLVYTRNDYIIFEYKSVVIFCTLQVLAWVIIKYQQPHIYNYFNSNRQPQSQLTHIQLPYQKKVSIIRLLFLLKRTSSLSRQSIEVDNIIDSYGQKLDLSYQDVNNIIDNDINLPQQEILAQITEDIHYLISHHNTKTLKEKCARIANISMTVEAQEIMKTIFSNNLSPNLSEESNAINPATIEIEVRQAPIQLLALLQGASQKSAFSDECNEIMQKYATRLGFDKNDVEQIMLSSMRTNPNKFIDNIKSNIESLSKHFSLNNFHNDCLRVIEISGEPSCRNIINFVFDNIMNEQNNE